MFQVKDFPSILAAMVNQMRAATTLITDYRPGSVARTIAEASAIELDELYQQMLNGLVEAIPSSLYLTFGFDLLPAAAATGRVTFSIPAPVGTPTVIVAGTAIADAGNVKTYATLEDVTIQAGGTSVTAPVRADEAGSSFNAEAGELDTMVNPIGDVSVTNAAPITNGRDVETEAERRIRFLDYITALSRGPIGAIQYGAKTAALTDANGAITEQVLEAKAVEAYITDNSQALGNVYVYLWNGVGAASAPLVAEAQKIIDGYVDGSGNKVEGWKAAGVEVHVSSVTTQAINVGLTVKTADGALTSEQEDALDERLTAYIDSVEIGGVVYRSELVAAALAVDGIIDAVVTAPVGDYVLTAAQKAIAGTLTYTVS